MQNLCVDGEGVKWQREVIGGEVDPGVPLTNINDSWGGGGVRQMFIFYTKKITTSECVYLKMSLLFLATQKIP